MSSGTLSSERRRVLWETVKNAIIANMTAREIASFQLQIRKPGIWRTTAVNLVPTMSIVVKRTRQGETFRPASQQVASAGEEIGLLKTVKTLRPDFTVVWTEVFHFSDRSIPFLSEIRPMATSVPMRVKTRFTDVGGGSLRSY
ncbi:hypothetical protein Pla52o_15780 [Novipirellula galeiformis]|uniref:Uncharacterized protein n=1 Tax=Novipirellula galeiformis TaxID=2528004 RepID=A0A5C6CL05_9BACT|nr:hypothetical protein Pla52o_15780 [Novipirellula galeiformis]